MKSVVNMRPVYKIFALMVFFVFVVSFAYNYNKIKDYEYFTKEINEMLFGLSYIVPLNVFGFIMKSQAKFMWERVISWIFLWIPLSALMDELFFDPFTPSIKEHFVCLTVLIIIYYYERLKKIRD